MLNSSACSILVSWDPLEAKEIEVEEELQSKFFWERSLQCRMEEAVRHSKQRSHHSTAGNSSKQQGASSQAEAEP